MDRELLMGSFMLILSAAVDGDGEMKEFNLN